MTAIRNEGEKEVEEMQKSNATEANSERGEEEVATLGQWAADKQLNTDTTLQIWNGRELEME